MGKKSISSDFLIARPSAVSGVARFFDFAGAFDAYNESRSIDEADAHAMYADWAVVGDSILSALSAACRLKAGDGEEEKAA
jgi:hypothetical protein